MATGPEHYVHAEELLNLVGGNWENAANALAALAVSAEAQVHATLALAAATAMGTAPGGMSPIDLEAWDRACGVQEEELDDESIDAGEEWRLAEREHQAWLAAEPGYQEPDEDDPCARCAGAGHDVADCEAILDDHPYTAAEDAADDAESET